MKMKFRLSWWQLIFYEIAVISVGLIIGAHWHSFFAKYSYFLLFLFAACGGYVLYVLVRQIEK